MAATLARILTTIMMVALREKHLTVAPSTTTTARLNYSQSWPGTGGENQQGYGNDRLFGVGLAGTKPPHGGYSGTLYVDASPVTEQNAESLPGVVVLVVEDEVLVRTFATDFLMEAGFKVFEAVDAEEAIAVLQARADIHAVFTDVEMPGSMTGVILANTIRERWPGVAVIVTSGREPPVDAILPDEIPFISKPYVPATVVGLIHKMVKPQTIAAATQANLYRERRGLFAGYGIM
jgi:two-component system, response regulator PdtaR